MKRKSTQKSNRRSDLDRLLLSNASRDLGRDFSSDTIDPDAASDDQEPILRPQMKLDAEGRSRISFTGSRMDHLFPCSRKKCSYCQTLVLMSLLLGTSPDKVVELLSQKA